jgi:multiple sugar transport system ATP-binding protein
MATVTISDLRKSYGTFEVVKGVSVDIRDGEFVVLVGPSGCGKSTLLRMIAGLEEITSGTVAIDGQVVNDVPSKDRDIAMVFQSYALYPHLTVAENMGFSLSLRRVDKATIDRRVREAAASLELTRLLDRYPKALSGGQRQRVAMGRAIVRDPRLFLFDEPLSNLDAKLRVTMRTELKEMHQRMGVTSIYVTHDQIEAMTMADRIVVLRDGLIEQEGAPLELYDRPVNTFVAGFIGSPAMNQIAGRASGGGVRVGDGLDLPLAVPAREGEAVTLGVRPEHLALAHPGAPGAIPARLRVVEPTGAETLLIAQAGEQSVTATVRERVTLPPGAEVGLLPDPRHLHWFREDGRRIG